MSMSNAKENERLENRLKRREYYQRNRERLIAVQMDYYWKHRDEILAKNKVRFRERMDAETPQQREKRLEMERVLRRYKKWDKSNVQESS